MQSSGDGDWEHAKIFKSPRPVYRRPGHVATLAFRSRCGFRRGRKSNDRGRG